MKYPAPKYQSRKQNINDTNKTSKHHRKYFTMPKFSLDINGVGQGAAEGRAGWSGELPPTGAYTGKLKVVSVGAISQAAKNPANRGKPKFNIGVELTDTMDGKYDGFIAWGSLNLIDSGIPYINQFLHALTDGSDKSTQAIEKAFYETGPIVDNEQKHVVKIGTLTINSPNGELPIKVAIKKSSYFNPETKQTTESSRIDSFLPGGGTAVKPKPATETVIEEEEDSLDDIFDDE